MEKLLKQKTIMISSITENGEAFISYAPFAKVGEKLYIYISKVAEHYYNICENPGVSVMIIQDEQDAKSAFARDRVSFKCTGAKLDEVSDEVWEVFEQTQGSELLQVLKSLDFDMFELTIQNGRLVKGFGKAYDIHLEQGTWVQEQVVGMGHRK